MLPACAIEAANGYGIPVAAIQQVVEKRVPGSSGIGPMGIQSAWLPVLQEYGFPIKKVKTSPCWGYAAGAWILATSEKGLGGFSVTNDGVIWRKSSEEENVVSKLPGLPPIPVSVIQAAHWAAKITGVSPNLLIAVAWQESGFNRKAVSPKGAMGLMQFMPGTWQVYGKGSPFNIKDAMLAGAKYLRSLADEFHSWKLALAGYNAGAHSVIYWHGIPPFQQTQQYVPSVIYKYDSVHLGFDGEKN